MALQIWLPLDGTLENKSCADAVIENNGATITDGKIGKCYSFDGDDDYISISSSKLNSIIKGGTYPFSLARWIYHADETRAILFGDYSTSGAIQFNVELTTGHHFRFYWNGAPDLYFNNTVYDAKWSHCVLTYDGANLRVYQDGVLNETKPYVLLEKNKTSGFYMLGRDNRTGTTALNGMLNDVRVYDHCLSQAEVNEIAQGLVLHYKLDNDGFGKSNLVPCGGYTKNSSWTTSMSNKDGFKSVTPSVFEATPSATYTISVECDGNISSTHASSGANPSDKLWTLWLYIRNTDTTKEDYSYDTAVCLNSTNNNYRKIGNTHVWTYTLSSTQKYISVRTNSYSDGETVLTLHWWNFKIEEGSEFTPWIPNTSNGLYKILGLDEKKIIDSSGYGRHGDVVGMAQFSTDTARYGNSYVMDGTVANRIEYNETTFNYTDNFSWAMWVKANYTGTGSQYVFTSGRADAGGYGFGLQNNGDTSLALRFGNKYYSMTIVKNEWSHVAFTKSGTTLKLYKNGELYSTQTFDGTLPTYSDGKGLGLGCFHYTGNIYPAYGSISDFRIYCTALSANAIKDIYRTSLKIDKDGKDHTFELVEDDRLNITKTGKFISPIYIESGYNFYEGGDISYKPAANKSNQTCPYNGVVNLSSVADLGIPISLNLEADFSWQNFAFDTSATTTLLQTQGDSRLKSNNTFTWTNGINNTLRLESYVSTSTSGTVHISGIKTIATNKFETFNGFRFGMRCDYSDGNGTLFLSNIKVTLADNKTKFTKSYVSANEFIER